MKNVIMIMMVTMSVFMLGLIGCTEKAPPAIIPSSGETGLTGSFSTYTYNPDLTVKTEKFSSEEELAEFLKTHQGSNTYGGVFRGGGDVMLEAAVMDSAVATKAMAAPPAGGTDFSLTNVQVEGVDEADIIKTDGEYIYVISGKKLFIVKAYPGEDAKVVSTIEFEEQPGELFINGDRLAVFGNYYNLDFFKKIDFVPRQGMSFFSVYDISDPEDPTLEKEFKFEGNYFRARMVGDWIYMVTTSRPDIRPLQPMPLIVEGTVKHTVPLSDIYYFNIPYDSTQLVSVHAINIGNPVDVNSKTLLVESNENLYMSEDNIYITYTKRLSEWQLQREIMMGLIEPELTSTDKNLIDKIKKIDDDVLTQSEKEDKIYRIYESYIQYMDDKDRDDFEERTEDLLQEKLEELKHLEYTVINKIHANNGVLTVEENGKVPGSIINQFSMDEYNDVFRIATTLSPRWWKGERSDSSNNIYTLDENMDILGSLTGMAENERIFSTRFIGERLYMVTFRQVDPFFVIDLSDPANPESLGELKIPGFSRYLHPYDKNTLIGIGQDASSSGRTRGLKVSLFDVSDVRNPEEVASYVTDERHAQSTALWEHRAFLFSKEKELLVIPAYNYNYGNGEDGYNGAMVFHITKDEIELRGLIDHSKGAERYYGPRVERSLYIKEMLYTMSQGLLRINALDDLKSVKDIELKGNTNMKVF